MRLGFTITGVSPLIMHNGATGLDTRSSLSREIAEIATKRGGNRTEVDDRRLRELECHRSLYLDDDERPTNDLVRRLRFSQPSVCQPQKDSPLFKRW